MWIGPGKPTKAMIFKFVQQISMFLSNQNRLFFRLTALLLLIIDLSNFQFQILEDSDG